MQMLLENLWKTSSEILLCKTIQVKAILGKLRVWLFITTALNFYSVKVKKVKIQSSYVTIHLLCLFISPYVQPIRNSQQAHTAFKFVVQRCLRQVFKWYLRYQFGLLLKTIQHDQAVSLSDCNGRFRCHHRSYEEYPCGQ